MPAPYLYQQHGDQYAPSEFCFGPWAQQTQNGAMVAGLLAQVLDRVESRVPMIPMDFHLEIHKPVPFRHCRIAVQLARDGAKLQVLRASMTDGVAEIAHATLVRLRDAPDLAPVQSITAHAEIPPERLSRMESRRPFFQVIDCRLLRGSFSEPGPAAAWMRVTCPIINGFPNSSLGMLATCADAGGGLSSLVPTSGWSYPNVSLALHCHRVMAGEWVLVDSTMRTQGHGVAKIFSNASDQHSSFGQVQQSVILEPKSTRATT